MIYGDDKMKIVHAQTILEQETLDELKERTGEHTTKDAISVAIDHYLECEYTKDKKL